MDSSFVTFLQIVADVDERGSLEGVTKVANLGVSCNQTSKPIVCHAGCWNQVSLATEFKACFAKDSNLLDDVPWLCLWIRARENVAIVQEYNFDAFHNALVDTERESSANVYVDVVTMLNTCRVVSQVASLSLPISLIVWRNDSDVLPKICETDR